MEPRAGSGRLSALERLLEPDLEGDFHRKWLAWEREMRGVTVKLRGQPSLDIQVAVIRRRTPGQLKEYLLLHVAGSKDDYNKFHDINEAYFEAQGSRSSMTGEAPRIDVLSPGLVQMASPPHTKGSGRGKGE